jgi:hypothetical protein
MTRIFMTGLEGRDLNIFTTIGASAAISTSYYRTGSASLYIHGTAWVVKKTLPSSLSELFMRFGLRANVDYSIGNCYFLTFFDADASVQIQVGLDSNSILQVYRGTTNIASGTHAISAQEWHCIEIRVKPAESPDGIVQIYIDGVLDVDFAGDTRATASSTLKSVQFGATSGSHYVKDLWIDDIAINDTAGAVNNSWIGRGGIHAIVPTGAGNSTDLTPSAGNNYAAVDEAPPDGDTTYVQGATVGDHDSYDHGDLTPTAGVISAVNWLAYAKLTEAGAGQIARVYRIGGADYVGANKILDTSYKYFEEILEVSPDSDDPFTISEVNAMEIGVKIT